MGAEPTAHSVALFRRARMALAVQACRGGRLETFAVVLLNWNSAPDTIECLASILDGEPSALPVVVDNASEDDSVSAIQRWAESRGVRPGVLPNHELASPNGPAFEADLLLVPGTANLGFAKGCNVGLQIARALGLRYVVFLNNDTVVAPGALGRLVSHLHMAPGLFATVPQIRIHGTDQIWNCGGQASRWGYRRYHYAGAEVASTVLPESIECTFFTGCCFAVRTEEFAGRGGFTERFFFGEEDFELCLWMLDKGKRAVCLTEAVVHHKVGVAVSRASRGAAPRAYVYYLNRFIHMRLRLGTVRWAGWVSLYLLHIAHLLYRTSTLPAWKIPRFLWRLVIDAAKHDSVDHGQFMRIMRTGY